jgi:type IV secretory pathway TraG/TraD family ATPase VirD4
LAQEGLNIGVGGALLLPLILTWLPIAVETVRHRQPVQKLVLSPAYAVLGTIGTGLAMIPILLGLQAATGMGAQAEWIGLALFPIGGYVTWRYLNRDRSNDIRQLLRGAQIAGSSAWLKETAKAKKRHGDEVLTLAGVFVNGDDEAKHFKILGTTGAGKSTAIRELMTGALKRGDRAVFADPSGDYLQRFYDPGRGDMILNPFDSRSACWDPFGEFSERFEVDQLVRSLIPADDEWSGYARTFVSAVIARCADAGARDLDEAWRLIAIAPSNELQALLTGTAAQPFLEEGNVRMFGSIRAVAVSALEALDYVRDQGGVPFSVRRWIREGQGVLFLPYQPEQIAALSTLVACWMRLAIFQTLGLADGVKQAGPERRLWFVIDELDALGRIHGLKDALARLRKAGGRCVIGFQSIAQVSTTYGQGEARTIVENCSNSLILRCSASEGGGTSEFASQLIGQREIARETVSVSHSSSFLQGRQRSVSYGTEHRIEQAVLPSEIEVLPDRCGLLKGASSDVWVRVAF